MDKNAETWRQYYQKAVTRKHNPRTERIIILNQSGYKTATDCGCGTGSDVHYLSELGYKVSGFDVNEDALTICHERFANNPLIDICQASFEHYNYPQAGVVLANSSLYFASPHEFKNTWRKISSSLAVGGVFAGDFIGVKDSWATDFQCPTAPMSKHDVIELFDGYEIIELTERDEAGQTMLGTTKHWHTFSVVAVKQT